MYSTYTEDFVRAQRTVGSIPRKIKKSYWNTSWYCR